MARKGENIFKRKDGRWEARYVKNYEPSGKIRYGFCYGKTYTEAKEKAARCRAALLNNTPLPATSRRRFSFFCEEWIRAQKSRVKESTYVKYDTALRLHILPGLGSCFPSGITTRSVETFQADLLGSGLSAQSVKSILIELRAIIKYTAAQYPGLFPDIQVQYPKDPKKEMRVLTLDEQRRLTVCLRSDMDACKFGIFLALMTGMRIGEICALRWENISLKDGTVHIGATVQRLRNIGRQEPGKTRLCTGAPKSDTSNRTIPLPDEVTALCGKYDPHLPSAYVLTGTEECMEPRKLQRRLAKYTKECGLEGVHFHTLRHTFATRCMEVGFELKSLSEILGHASTSTTLDRYVHSSIDLKRTNMEKLAAVGF